jgi:flagellar FliL protein
MAEADAAKTAKTDGPKPARRRGRLLILLLVPVLLAAAAGGIFLFRPTLLAGLGGLLPQKAAPAAEAARPVFVELPEMTVTLPNGGRQRQLRIKLSLEVAKVGEDQKAPDIIGPRVYDALITYMRTLRDPELDGAIAVDRLRGDLFRRLDLLLGHGVLRDVLITSLVVA